MAVVDKVAGKHGTAAVAAGLPRVPVHGRGPGDRGQALLPARDSRRWPAKYAAQFPKVDAVHDRRGVRRLEEGAADALRRRRRVRPDLSAGALAPAAVYPYEGMTMRHESRSVLPGFGLSLGYHAAPTSSLIVLLPLATRLRRRRRTSRWAAFWAHGHRPAGAGVLPADLRRLARRGADQRRVRPAGGLGAGALPVSRAGGWSTRWSTCRSRCRPRCRHRADDALRRERLDRAATSSRSGIKVAYHAARHHRRADLHRPAVRRAHGAAGARGPRVEVEEAAASLGASRWQTFRRVILPTVAPALLTGFALAFARAVGEYGSVVFISGNMPMKTEIAPLLIITKLEQFDYAGATAIARGDAASPRSCCCSPSTCCSGWRGAARRPEPWRRSPSSRRPPRRRGPSAARPASPRWCAGR